MCQPHLLSVGWYFILFCTLSSSLEIDYCHLWFNSITSSSCPVTLKLYLETCRKVEASDVFVTKVSYNCVHTSPFCVETNSQLMTASTQRSVSFLKCVHLKTDWVFERKPAESQPVLSHGKVPDRITAALLWPMSVHSNKADSPSCLHTLESYVFELILSHKAHFCWAFVGRKYQYASLSFSLMQSETGIWLPNCEKLKKQEFCRQKKTSRSGRLSAACRSRGTRAQCHFTALRGGLDAGKDLGKRTETEGGGEEEVREGG